MLFYRTAHWSRNAGPVPATTRPTPTTDYPMRAPWMLKCLVVGTAMLVLAYWLVRIAGAQYLATLTSATLLSFLLVYIVWCLTVKRRQTPQQTDSAETADPPDLPTTSSALPALSLHPVLKYYGVPPRDCSPPPSYDEVLRQMGAAAAAAAAAVAAATAAAAAAAAATAASTSGVITTTLPSSSTQCDVEAPPTEEIDHATPSSSSLPDFTVESRDETRVGAQHSLEESTAIQETTPADKSLASTATSTPIATASGTTAALSTTTHTNTANFTRERASESMVPTTSTSAAEAMPSTKSMSTPETTPAGDVAVEVPSFGIADGDTERLEADVSIEVV